MTELINIQFNMAVVAIVLGVIMGFSYDCIRCFRRVLSHNNVFISIEDFMYWFVWTWLVMDAIMCFNYGQLRAYIVVTLFLGFLIYKITIGWVFMKSFNYIWCPIKKCLHNAKKNLKNNENDSTI